MSTTNISLPEALKSFVDDQVSTRGYSTSSEYVRELIRKDHDRQRLRGPLLEGVASAQALAGDADYLDRLRCRVLEASRQWAANQSSFAPREYETTGGKSP